MITALSSNTSPPQTFNNNINSSSSSSSNNNNDSSSNSTGINATAGNININIRTTFQMTSTGDQQYTKAKEIGLGSFPKPSDAFNDFSKSGTSNSSGGDPPTETTTEYSYHEEEKSSSSASIKGSSSTHAAATAAATTPSSSTTTRSLLIQPNNVCKVIKGEIHNVLNVMRQDARYASPLRFMEELPSDEQHPVLAQLKELHAAICEWELYPDQRYPINAIQPEAKLYLPPFCAAIQGRDISAAVTGAALNSLMKFVLYGFLANEKNPGQVYKTIANTLLMCTFEESSPSGNDANPAAAIGADKIRTPFSSDPNRDDEQVVLKLLDLSALIIRLACHTLSAELVVGLLETCLHVSHRAKRASSLLKSAASDALGQIVLQVFSQPNLVKVREAILHKLASLLNPRQNTNAHAINSLTLVNIALETMQGEPSPTEIEILQNDLCKYLLQWSTTHDLVLLSLTLRVIFNLFQTIRNELKIPLEVFLTSVHLRIVEHAARFEEREVAIESLLEFCQEPAMMKDLYWNYDCDVQCTNLYESICSTLGRVAAPTPSTFRPQVKVEMMDDNASVATSRSTHTANNGNGAAAAAAAAAMPLNALSLLALEGLMAIIDSIARRCDNSDNSHSMESVLAALGAPVGETVLPTNNLEVDASIEEELQEQKRLKFNLTRTAKAFNKNPTSDVWIRIGKDVGALEDTMVTEELVEEVAKFLYTAPGLDKDKVGMYLSLGPAEKYPFEEQVRIAFVQQFDFADLSFAAALRLFLSKFRLPGEAQCIDRLMEAFSKELFFQQGDDSVFSTSDSVFVLAFSTIMLNTDLHNQNMKNMVKMTREQFIKNNKGINAGGDLPEDMLIDVYEQIKSSAIQVQKEISEFMWSNNSGQMILAEDFRAAWDEVLAKEVATAVFTPADEARNTLYQAGLHEKEMFLTVAPFAMKALKSAFIRSWDDGCVVEVLKGFEQVARISLFFDLDVVFNDVVKYLLTHGKEYIIGCISLEYAGIESGAPINQSPEDDETMSIVDPDSPLPHSLLRIRTMKAVNPKRIDISGSAAYRGLLALNIGLKMVRDEFHRIRDAWPLLIEVLCALRDARALPAGLADLDDFADSNGHVLPLSPFAQKSQKNLDEFYRGKNGQDNGEQKGWFRLEFFKKGGPKAGEEVQKSKPMPEKVIGSNRGELSINAKTLLQIAERVEVEKFMSLSLKTKDTVVKHSVIRLLEGVDQFPAEKDLTFEQHQAFALELAARALFINQERAIELYPVFLAKFDSIAHQVHGVKDPPVPFVLERIMATILRSCIHLYSVPELQIRLKSSLHMLTAFPQKKFIRHVSDRMACGLAIILRSSFHHFENAEDWGFLGETFDLLASFTMARGLVFDGIASTVEFAVPSDINDDLDALEERILETPTLGVPGCTALLQNLIKYIYGSYDNDFALQVPAMLCVEKIYKHIVQMMMIVQRNNPAIHEKVTLVTVPDKDLWFRVAGALYTVCLSADADTSKHGWECFQRHALTIDVREVPDDKWIALLNLMVTTQPPIEADSSRVNTFSVLGQLMMRVVPILTQRKANFQPVTEVTKKVAVLAEINLVQGREGQVKSLFDYTVQTLTYLSNHMVSNDFAGDKRYSAWASETLQAVLAKFGIEDVTVAKKN